MWAARSWRVNLGGSRRLPPDNPGKEEFAGTAVCRNTKRTDGRMAEQVCAAAYETTGHLMWLALVGAPASTLVRPFVGDRSLLTHPGPMTLGVSRPELVGLGAVLVSLLHAALVVGGGLDEVHGVELLDGVAGGSEGAE